MKPRLFLNLLMILMLGILISIALLYQPENLTEKKLTSLNIDDIQSLRIPRDKGDIVLRKKDNHWQMLSPYEMPAHDFRIKQLLKLTQLTSTKVYSAEKLDLEKFSLAPPRARIQFNNTWIELGTTSPVTQQRYIKSDNTVLLAYDDSYPLINSQPSSFVSLSLLDQNDEIQGITLSEQKLEKQQNKWLISPKQKNIGADDIQGFIQNWKMAKAFGVHAYMKRKQLGQIIIKTKASELTFEITDKTPWLILARPDIGIEYHLDESMADKLLSIQPAEQEPQAPGDN